MRSPKFLFLCLLTLAVLTATAQHVERTITHVEHISVTCPTGTVPRLPYQLLVIYSDSTQAYRQVRWSNASLATEQELADSSHYPTGTTYIIEGHITGDDTTPNGYPVTAHISVSADTYATPSSTPIAEAIPLSRVRLTGDNRLTSNRDLAIREILSWDITQQLYNYRDTYGLSTEGYTMSDGWDSPTTKLKGHGSGHYMSALAFAFASATDAGQKEALRHRIQRMVDELRLCQERTFVWNDSLGRYWEARDFAPEAELRTMQGTWTSFEQHKTRWEQYGYGYLNAIPAHHPALIEMYRGYNNEAWVWAPYYAIHKQLAGLIDIATYIDDKAISSKALLIAKDMGLWIWNRLHYRTYVKSEGTREERRATPGNRYEMWNMYIAGEDGGTGESLARLAEMVTDPTEKAHLIEASNYFDSPAFYDPLSRNIDDIRTRHANQHIPKITSALRSYRTNDNAYYYNIAENFWTLIQGRYTYATGGVGNGEMFRQPYTQILSMNTNVAMNHQRELCPNPTLNETCCAYNLAKLTKDLNSFNPDDARYMDYYERVLYNQIVGSLHPEHYLTTYHYAVGLNASKPWGNRTPQESCCGGTGSESHVKYQEAIYFTSDDCLWVALYMPSIAEWEAQGITLEQECLWPAEHSTLRITKGQGKFAMKLRIPYWATSGVKITLNGKLIAVSVSDKESYTAMTEVLPIKGADAQASVATTAGLSAPRSLARELSEGILPCSYVTIPTRRWRKGDVVEIHLPFTKHINYGPDRMTTAATAPGETNTPFTPMWVGTLMYGPLAMGTTDINNWHDATITLDSNLNNIIANRPTTESGTHGNLYTLTVEGHTFLPDYALDHHQTHYLRIATTESSTGSDANLNELQALLLIAKERKQAQESWHTLTIKVPDYAPWAPHGYARLMEQYATADSLMRDAHSSSADHSLSLAVAHLSAAINTMRPGNLAELEDLSELLPLISRAKQQPSRSTTLQKAIEYAEMVVSYVSDGSGTHDMIQRATTLLKNEQ